MINKPNKNKDDSSGNLPINVLNLINEYTVGGFIIFYFNQNTGRPEQMMNFDSPAHSLALQKHLGDWTDAVNEVNFQNTVDNIRNALSDKQKEEESDDEEDGGNSKI